ncbi:MAG: TetR/AcrR family transcriptional regulator [Candidatus Delongbacteria bacterium]
MPVSLPFPNPASPPPAGESPGTPLWHSLPAGKRELVVQAAVEEFASHGYEGASLNTVVRQAGISKGSLFTYFPSKAVLFDALVRLAAGGIREDLRALRDRTRQESFAQRLEALVRTGLDFLEQRPQLARIWFRVLPGSQVPLGRRQVEALRRRSRDFLEELIREGQERGELRGDLEAGRLAFLLNLHLEALLNAWQERDQQLEVEPGPGREELVRDFLALTLRGMAHQPEGAA